MPDPDVKPNDPRAEWNQAFDSDFWPEYPRKVAKHMARQAWERIFNHRLDYAGHEDLLGRICAGLEWYKDGEWRDGRDLSKIPHASTWLNQRRWEDAFDEA